MGEQHTSLPLISTRESTSMNPKQRTQAIMDDMSQGQARTLFEAMAHDAIWRWMGVHRWSQTFVGKQAIADTLFGGQTDTMRPSSRVVVHAVHGEGDVVIVEHSGRNELPDGRRYDNNYCWIFDWCDGRIQEVREYMDTQLVTETFDEAIESPVNFQLVIDCTNPDRLSRFWANALRYDLQPAPAGYSSWDAYWRDVGVPEHELGLGADSIVDPGGRGPRIWFQVVPEHKTTKNRLHFDITVSGGRTVPIEIRRQRVDAEAARLASLGAQLLGEVDTDGLDHYAVAMKDPEGNEFDIN